MDPEKEIRVLRNRLEKLEKRDIRLKDLPVSMIRRAVLFDEPVDPIQLLLPSSVTVDVLSEDVVARLNP